MKIRDATYGEQGPPTLVFGTRSGYPMSRVPAL
jgi:hypothetical protein